MEEFWEFLRDLTVEVTADFMRPVLLALLGSLLLLPRFFRGCCMAKPWQPCRFSPVCAEHSWRTIWSNRHHYAAGPHGERMGNCNGFIDVWGVVHSDGGGRGDP